MTAFIDEQNTASKNLYRISTTKNSAPLWDELNCDQSIYVSPPSKSRLFTAGEHPFVFRMGRALKISSYDGGGNARVILAIFIDTIAKNLAKYLLLQFTKCTH